MARDYYIKQDWENLPNETTPITAERLVHIEDGIKNAAEKRALKDIYDDESVNFGRRSESEVGYKSIALGTNSVASENYSISTGSFSEATAVCSYAGGQNTKATAKNSVANGYRSKSSGENSVSNGEETEASGANSYAGGLGTVSAGKEQYVHGRYNEIDENGIYAHIIGGGRTSSNRKNILSLDWNGNLEIEGDVTNGQGVSLNSLKGSIDTILSILQSNESNQ